MQTQVFLFQTGNQLVLDFCLNLVFTGGDNTVYRVQTDGITDVALCQCFQDRNRIFRCVEEFHRVRNLVFHEEIYVNEVVVGGDHQGFTLNGSLRIHIVADGETIDDSGDLLHLLNERKLEVQTRLTDCGRITEGGYHRLLLFIDAVH